MSDKQSNCSRRAFLGVGGAAVGAALAVSTIPIISKGTLLALTSEKQHNWGFLIDLERCIGCKACSVACKTEFNLPLGEFRSSVKEYDTGKYPNVKRDFVPWMCNHCENPICIAECPVDEMEAAFTWPDQSKTIYKKRATFKRPDGIVLVDYDRCIGCGACVELCPYKVRFLNPARKNGDGDPVADKCTLCVHRLDAGMVPACVNTCQADARIVGDLNDPDSEISRLVRDKEVQVLLPREGTEPNCKYIALNPLAYTDGRDTR